MTKLRLLFKGTNAANFVFGAQPITFSAAANATGSRADKDAGFDSLRRFDFL
jgi:hypothetical protein